MNIEDFTSKVRRAIRAEVKETPWLPGALNSDKDVDKTVLVAFQQELKALSTKDREELLEEALETFGKVSRPKLFPDGRAQALYNGMQSEMALWLRAVAPLFKVVV
jgi:hypothetical protein